MDMPAAGIGDGDLRARSALELADAAVTACRHWFIDLVAVSLVFCAPALAVGWVLVAVVSNVGPLIGAMVIAVAMAHAGCVDIAGDGWLGGQPAWRPAVRRTFKRGPSVLAVWAIGGIVVGVATLFLIVPGVIVALSFMLAIPLLVLERISPMQALRRSFRLSQGRRPAFLATLVLLLGIVGVLLAILVQPVAAAALVTGGRDAPFIIGVAVTQLAACILAVPLVASATTAAYLDTRVRKEALDLLYLFSIAS